MTETDTSTSPVKTVVLVALALALSACGAMAGTGSSTRPSTQAAATQASATTPASSQPTPTPQPIASISGIQLAYTITDTDSLELIGTTIPGAEVTVMGGQAEVNVFADSKGNFDADVTGIPMGDSTLTVDVAAAGYQSGLMSVSVTRNVSEAGYKQSAESIPYNLLSKDPASLAGTPVTYEGQVFQYDSATGTSNFIVSVTNDGYGIWSDNIWADVDPSIAQNVCTDTIIRFWGDVVGPYTYTTTMNGELTIPEVKIRYVDVVSNSC
jgi:hypothetical protein